MFSRLTKKAKAGLALGILAVGTAGFLFGGQAITLAFAIRGWDYPWDPPNYYSPTNISWADTNNPSFFYRDLGWQGGNVYDLTREIKSKLFGDDFINILAQVADKLGISLINAQPLDSSTKDMGPFVLHLTSDATDGIYADNEAVQLTGSPFFHQAGESGNIEALPRDTARQHQLIAAAAEAYAQNAQNATGTKDATMDAVDKLLEAASRAQGERELREIETQLAAIAASQDTELSALLASKIQMEQDQQRVAYDEEQEWLRTVHENTIYFTDPYDEEAVQKSGYQKPKPLGFVKFK